MQNEPAYRGISALSGRSDAISLIDRAANQDRRALPGRAQRRPRKHSIEALKIAQSRGQPFFEGQRPQQDIQYVACPSAALVFSLSADFLSFLNGTADQQGGAITHAY